MPAEPAAADFACSGRDERAESGLRVAALYYYPVKSCAPVATTEAILTRAGLDQDRGFMVTDQDGRYRTQRRHPRLALIRPVLSADSTRLVLRSPETGSVDVDVAIAGARRKVDLFGVTYLGIDQGDEVATWLSDTLGVPSRLVRVPPEHARVTDGYTVGTSGYADSCAIHILSESSLERLNRELSASGSLVLPMSRFRPNIVIAGAREAHEEDTLRRIRIGGAELGYAKPAVRCVVTTVDQTRGSKSGPEPLTTLATYRRALDGGIVFGAKFAVTETGKLSVGDEITVRARGPGIDLVHRFDEQLDQRR